MSAYLFERKLCERKDRSKSSESFHGLEEADLAVLQEHQDCSASFSGQVRVMRHHNRGFSEFLLSASRIIIPPMCAAIRRIPTIVVGSS